jgi:hypothetical protein
MTLDSVPGLTVSVILPGHLSRHKELLMAPKSMYEQLLHFPLPLRMLLRILEGLDFSFAEV